MSKIHFSLAEANALLPTLRKELVELQQLKHKFQYQLKKLNKIKEANHELQTDSKEIFMNESELEFIEMQAQLHAYNIESLGVQLKDIDLGLLDFPSLKDGKEILLCWKQGEPTITHYHGEHEGFSGRKPL
ncbi:DUF2203 domain-containing protein [Halalkalibacter kiskunsagensis]|uniref:DUF2203 domain-containing protein n=1 Tax=Halalkalibacter kiskunsagensis TaxID=1548599 RepID=A0ABV6KDY1_9BACI